MSTATWRDDALESIQEHADLVESLTEDLEPLEKACRLLGECLTGGGKVLACGNGGSAADAQHFVAELVGRFERDRQGLAALSLAADPSVVTAVGNDFGFESVFARQVDALARAGDLLVAISTSGRSANVVAAAASARRIGLPVIALVGEDPRGLAGSDVVLSVPSSTVARIQELHIVLLHLMCESLDRDLAARSEETS